MVSLPYEMSTSLLKHADNRRVEGGYEIYIQMNNVKWTSNDRTQEHCRGASSGYRCCTYVILHRDPEVV
jgi:hypothetical protein